MNLVLRHRESIIWNMLGALIFSLIFFHTLRALEENKSAFDLVFLLSHGHSPSSLVVGVLGIITGISLYFVHKSSRFLLFCFWGFIFGHTVFYLIFHYQKVVLCLLGFFLIIVYFFYLLWNLELQNPLYNPRYVQYQVEALPHLVIPVEVNSSNGVFEVGGILTNWSEHFCFIKMMRPLNAKELKQRKKNILLRIEYEGRKFEQWAVISSFMRDGSGMGLKFIYNDSNNKEQNTQFTWNQFYFLLKDLGFHSHLVI